MSVTSDYQLKLEARLLQWPIADPCNKHRSHIHARQDTSVSFAPLGEHSVQALDLLLRFGQDVGVGLGITGDGSTSGVPWGAPGGTHES